MPRIIHFRLRGAIAVALSTLLTTTAVVSAAHDWPSPPVSPPVSQSTPAGAVWSGLSWAGPRSGAPKAPVATDCRRAPQAIELQGPDLPISVARRETRALAAAAPAKSLEAAPERELAKPGPAPAAAPAPGALLGRRPSTDTALAVAPPVTAEPVSAGVIDDNADFGEYQAFVKRHAQLPVRHRDVSERYLLTVHDAAGRVVPDAQVSLFAGGEARPLWARTDAGGQVWLHPKAAGLADAVLEVQVRKASADGELRGSALLKRGQRDALQVRLDANAPLERARLDLVFLVDATGSMGDEIDKLRSSMQAMADQIGRLPSKPQICFGLVAYRDRGDQFFVRAHDLTDDLGAFQQVLGGLRAGGGGDYPEAMNEALHTAVHRISWRGQGATRLVVLVADAPPHLDYGQPWYDDDMQGALARGIKLFAVGASGLDRTGEAVFRQMAQYTGGRFVFLTYADARQPSSGPGRETTHDVGNYSVESLDKLVVRLVREELGRRPG
jgi:Mg-chelatase subunit ChlD